MWVATGRNNHNGPGMLLDGLPLSAGIRRGVAMDSRHCCVCGHEIMQMDVYIFRLQGKICSRCVLERGIPVGGKVSRQMLHRGTWNGAPAQPRLATVGG
jgi:hypothetical protein